MRVPLAIMLAAGLALVLIGAQVPEAFVLSLLGLLVIAGAASVGVASYLQSAGTPDRRQPAP